MNVFCLTFDGFHGFQAVFPTSRAQWFECEFSTDAAPSGRSVAFTGGELCDYAFGYATFPLWVRSCPFLGEQLTYVEGTLRSFR